MKLKLAAAVVAAFVSQGVLAMAAPQSCPSVEQLQANGVTMAMQDPDQLGSWIGINPSNSFGTSDNWTFLAGVVQSQAQADAVTQINQKIPSLNLVLGPEQDQESNEFVCLYINQTNDFFGVTVTPAIALSKGFNHFIKMKK